MAGLNGAPGPAPTLRLERQLMRSGRPLVAGMDEVGRGALGGPVTVGVTLVDATVRTAPVGLRDSKLLAPPVRDRLAPRLRRWALAHAVGHATAREIDLVGILAALRLAGLRALAALPARPDVVVLDGNYDWLTRCRQPVPAPAGQLALDLPPAAEGPGEPGVPVVTCIKADLRCAAVAAASVLAKTCRDALMVELAATHPGYGWEVNRGYATPTHLQAIRARGPCAQHRLSWRLTGPDAGRPPERPGPLPPDEECVRMEPMDIPIDLPAGPAGPALGRSESAARLP